MEHQTFRSRAMRKRWLVPLGIAILAAVAVPVAVTRHGARAATTKSSSRAGDIGPTSGLLERNQLTLESAIQVDLSKETVRLPLYKGKANGQTVWYVLLDASDAGLAHDLGVNFAPKLANIAIGCPDCVQTVTLEAPTPQQNRFGQAVVDFQGAPDFSPTRIATPGPNGFPLAAVQPGCDAAGSHWSPPSRGPTKTLWVTGYADLPIHRRKGQRSCLTRLRISRALDARVTSEMGRNCGRAQWPCRAPVRVGASTDWSE